MAIDIFLFNIFVWYNYDFRRHNVHLIDWFAEAETDKLHPKVGAFGFFWKDDNKRKSARTDFRHEINNKSIEDD